MSAVIELVAWPLLAPLLILIVSTVWLFISRRPQPIQIPLWPNKPHPCMTVYLPRRAKGRLPVIIVFRGGGWLSCASSGGGTAKWAADNGFVGVEVEYAAKTGAHPLKGPRLPEGSVLGDLPEGESAYPQCLRDAARSIRLVRQLAAAGELPIDPNRVCACGFSAGGWLAGMLASSQGEALTAACDDLSTYGGGSGYSCVPDRAVLCYAVTSLHNPDDPQRMLDSYELLLGDQTANDELRRTLSPADQLDGTTCPPLFIWHTLHDGTVPSSHSIEMYAAARKAGVEDVALHVFSTGSVQGDRHAQGLAESNPVLCGWPKQMLAWLGPAWRPSVPYPFAYTR